MKYELSIEAAAKILSVSESRISQLISNGSLDTTTIRGNRRISKESVEAYASQRTGRGRKPIAYKASTKHFTLMNASHEVMELIYDPTSDLPFIGKHVFDQQRAPLSVLTSAGSCKRRELNEWWEHRSIPRSRPGLEKKLLDLGLENPATLPLRNLGLSLSDCYWLRPQDHADISWDQINYFQNNYDGASDENWDDWLANVGIDSPDNTSEGELPKKWVIKNGKRVLIKGFRTNDQLPFNEVVATFLHKRLLSPSDYVTYEIVNTKNGVACACENFLSKNEEYIPAVYIKRILGSTRGNSTYERLCRFAGKLGMDEKTVRQTFGKMIICDFILANNDRHWRNFGFIRNVETLEMRPAPLFDSGNCLWCRKADSEIALNDWSFLSRPFHTCPEQQLSLAEDFDWFNESTLDSFTDQALEILSQSSYVTENKRLTFIEEGLRKQITTACAALSVLRYR